MKKQLLPTTIRSFISREMMHHNTLRRNTGKQKVGIFELLHIGSTKEVIVRYLTVTEVLQSRTKCKTG